MIRKFFASIFLVLFIALLPPMLIMESVAENFFDADSLTTRLIPQTYLPMTMVAAEQSSHTKADTELFTQRIRSVLPRETYNGLMKAFVDGVDSEGVDFRVLKNRLSQVDGEIAEKLPPCSADEPSEEGFRFCVPYTRASISKTIQVERMKEVLDTLIAKQIPDRVNFSNIEDSRVKDFIAVFPRVRAQLPMAIFVTAGVALLMTALIIFTPSSSVMKWLGSPLLILALLLGLFLLGIHKLIEKAQIEQVVSAAQGDLIATMLSFPLQTLGFWTALIGGGGVLLCGGGFLTARRKTQTNAYKK